MESDPSRVNSVISLRISCCERCWLASVEGRSKCFSSLFSFIRLHTNPCGFDYGSVGGTGIAVSSSCKYYNNLHVSQLIPPMIPPPRKLSEDVHGISTPPSPLCAIRRSIDVSFAPSFRTFEVVCYLPESRRSAFLARGASEWRGHGSNPFSCNSRAHLALNECASVSRKPIGRTAPRARWVLS